MSIAVSTWSRHLSGWVARRGLGAESVSLMAVGVGLLAATWLASGERVGLASGAALLAATIALDRLRARLAVRATPWLPATLLRVTEYACYVGLASGVATRARSGEVWGLAAATVIVQAVRDLLDHVPAPLPAPYAADARPWARGARIALTCPDRARLALLAVTAVVLDPAVIFMILLGWGALAAFATLVRRLEGPPRPGAFAADVGAGAVATSRCDGPLARRLGVIIAGQLPPLPPVLAGALVSFVLICVGLPGSRAPTLLAPVFAMLLAGVAAGHPHDGRFDWLVPMILRVTEYVFLAVVGLGGGVPPALVVALLGMVAVHHGGVVRQLRHGGVPTGWPAQATLGWEGRMLLVALAGTLGWLIVAYATLTAYLATIFAIGCARAWLTTVAASSEADATSR